MSPGLVLRARPPMAENDRSWFARSTRSLQENIRQSAPAAAASYTLVGAILLLGGIGYALDAWLGTTPWFLLAGLVCGIVVGFYELVKVASRR